MIQADKKCKNSKQIKKIENLGQISAISAFSTFRSLQYARERKLLYWIAKVISRLKKQ